jgi:hexosaminidase
VTLTQDLLIPVHRSATRRGALRLPDSVILASPSDADILPLMQLAVDLHQQGIRTMIVGGESASATVRICRDPAVRGTEAYRLTVSPKGVEIRASADAGAYYAVQTLRELLSMERGGSPYPPRGGCGDPPRSPYCVLPACSIDDRPDFDRRGVYLDCSRGKVPRLETLLAMVEQLARWKINELQLYVENVFTWRSHPQIGRGYSPFTPEELRAVQDRCRRHHVRLVGSLASLGHMEKILSVPKYQHLGELAGYRGFPGGTTLCPTDAGSLRLMRDLYEEFLPLFEATDFNACLDEPWELGQGRSRRRAERMGKGRVYLDYLKKIYGLCLRHGKRMNAWADIVLEHPEIIADLPPDIVMLNWDYNPQGTRIGRTREITEAGLAAVVCPGTNAWQSHGCRLAMGMQNISRFATEGLRCGAEGFLNTDWGDYGHRNMLAVSLHNYAYGAAHAWHHKGVRDEGFTERFCRHTFGQAGAAMAEPIRVLGRAQEALALPYRNNTPLYNVFTGPLKKWATADDWQVTPLDSVKPQALASHRSDLAALRWPRPQRDGDPFLQVALEEYALATDLDRLACLRAAAVKDVRAGKSPRAGVLKQLIRETEEVTAELRRVWLLGNKPSRLRDELTALRQAVREYRRMLKR